MRAFGVRWVALIGLVLVFGLGACDRGGEGAGETGCATAADCPEGVCHEGVCVECAEDGDCATGVDCELAVCINGACSVETIPGCGQYVDVDEDGWSEDEGDCDDDDPDVNPGAEEACNGKDDDCDGDLDEGCGPPPCVENDDCGEGEFCTRQACDDPKGLCEPMPEGCDKVYLPVCGCDGQTWGNECEAWMNGVSVDHEGECEVVPPTCEENGDCGAGAWCAKAPGDCDGQGQCAPLSGGDCPAVWMPVCGCDGETYGNDCEAAAAGVNVDFEGECEVLPPICETNGDCDEGAYCALDVGECEGVGTCEEKPLGCDDVWEPVCGCDGETYGNDCEAAVAGVNVASDSACAQPGCWSNQDCGVGEYCLFEPCAAETGVCAVQPDLCPDVWAPVCGCDGKTYSNTCDAAAAGVSVDYDGECGVDEGCWADDMCAPGEFCFYPGCGAKSGDCVEIPQICPTLWDPVCGCDGATYANLCVLMVAGQSMDYEGECAP